MAKRSAKKAGHQSFKLSAHNHTQERVIMLVLIAVAVGLVAGLFLSSNVVPMSGY